MSQARIRTQPDGSHAFEAKRKTAAAAVTQHTADRHLPCPSCGGEGLMHHPVRGDFLCPKCQGDGGFEAADHWEPSQKHPDQQPTTEYASNPKPGTTVWRGEVRHRDHVSDPPSVGMHWTTNPNQIVLPHSVPKDHVPVMWEARLDHPDQQAISRSHPIWRGKHRSMDSEAEVRIHPGQQVHVTRSFHWDPERESKGAPIPDHSDRSPAGWRENQVGKDVTVHHRPTSDMIDYTDVGVKHEGSLDGPWQTHIHGDRADWMKRTEEDHKGHLEAQRADAERATNGNMVSAAGRAKGITGDDFFKPGNRRSIEQWGSDEMKRWHGSENTAQVGDTSQLGHVFGLSEYRRHVMDGERAAYQDHVDQYGEPEHHDEHDDEFDSPEWHAKWGARRQAVMDTWRPTERLFSPTKGNVDPILFGADRAMRPEVREEILSVTDEFFLDHHYGDTTGWARVYLAGSQASEWYGNRDFDVLIGVNYDAFRKAHPEYEGMSVDEIDGIFNTELREDFNNPDWHPSFDREQSWDRTGYVFHVPPSLVRAAKVGEWHPRENSPLNNSDASLRSTSKETSPQQTWPKTLVSTSSLSADTSNLPEYPETCLGEGAEWQSGRPDPAASAVRSSPAAEGDAKTAGGSITGSTTSPERWASQSSFTSRLSNPKAASAPSVESPTRSSQWITTTPAAQDDGPAENASGGSSARDATERLASLATRTSNAPPPTSEENDGRTWDISLIKPYAAYNVTDDVWAVEPIHEPTGHQFNETEIYYFEGVAAQARAALNLPEPQRTQRCTQIWEFIHSDRSRAFGPHGTGAFDRGNALEKYLSQCSTDPTVRESVSDEDSLMGALARVRYGVTKSSADLVQLPDATRRKQAEAASSSDVQSLQGVQARRDVRGNQERLQGLPQQGAGRADEGSEERRHTASVRQVRQDVPGVSDDHDGVQGVFGEVLPRLLQAQGSQGPGVPGTEATTSAQLAFEEDLRDHDRAVRGDARTAGREVRDLRGDGRSVGPGQHVRGSQPQDGRVAGTAVRDVQLRSAQSGGRRGVPAEGAELRAQAQRDVVSGKEQKTAAVTPEGYSLEVRHSRVNSPGLDLPWEGMPKMDVYATHQGREVGHLGVHQRTGEDGSPFIVPNISVHPEHQRKGLATAMYGEVHKHWPGIPVVHSEHRTDDARGLDRSLAEHFDSGLHQYPTGQKPWWQTGKTAAYGDAPWYASAPESEIDAHQVGDRIRRDEMGSHTSPEGHRYRLVRHSVPGIVSAHYMGKEGQPDVKHPQTAGYVSWFAPDRAKKSEHTVSHPFNEFAHYEPDAKGQIYKAHVEKQHQRRGVASALLDFARSGVAYPIEHSHALTDDGKAWAEKKAAIIPRGVDYAAFLRHTAMAWENRQDGINPAHAKSVRHAGYAGYVGDSERDEELGHSRDHDEFDEDLYDQTSPEPTHEEQRHYDKHGEYPDSHYERHDQAYQEALDKKQQENEPDHDDPELHEFIGEHGDNSKLWHEKATLGKVSLTGPVYATQSHVNQEHIDRYRADPGGESHQMQSNERYRKVREEHPYLADKHPMFVTHQGRLHVTDGHHRVAAALQDGKKSIVGWHYDGDKHGLPGYEDDEDWSHEAALHHTGAAASDYFSGGVDDLLEAPFEQVPHQKIRLDEQHWKSLPVKDVPLEGLKRTQKSIFKKHLTRNNKTENGGNDDLPWVIHHGGEHWVIDGHHRAVNAMQRGDSTFKAHVMQSPFDDHEKVSLRTALLRVSEDYQRRTAAADWDVTREYTPSGGSKFGTRYTLSAKDANGEEQGWVRYHEPKRKGSPIHVEEVRGSVPGAASHLLNHMEDLHPNASKTVFLNEKNTRHKNTPSHHDGEHGKPTDWDQHYEGLGDIHRGFSVRLNSFDARKVNSPDYPVEDHVKALRDKVDESNAGIHWTAGLQEAKNFSQKHRYDPRTDIPVILHAKRPERKDIETRPSELFRNGVFPHTHLEKEVPVRRGRNVQLTGMSWKPDSPHPDADEHGWLHHEFDQPISKRARLSSSGYLDLYHRTTPEAADSIVSGGGFTSKENRHDGQPVYFSTHLHGGEGEGYGSAAVHVRIPERLADLDDEFPDGEQHYAVPSHEIRPEHIVGRVASSVASVEDDPARWGADGWRAREMKRSTLRETHRNGEYTYHHAPGPLNDDDEGYGNIYVTHGDDPHNVVGESYYGPHPGRQEHLELASRVAPEHRRKGVATGMYDFAERLTGKPTAPADINSQQAQGFWANRLQPKTAASAKHTHGDYEAIALHWKDGSGEASAYHTPTGKRVADMRWGKVHTAPGCAEGEKHCTDPSHFTSGVIQAMGVHPEHRRQGVATAMLQAAHKAGVTPVHSPDRSDAGDAWARSLGVDLPERKSNPPSYFFDPETMEHHAAREPYPSLPEGWDHQPGKDGSAIRSIYTHADTGTSVYFPKHEQHGPNVTLTERDEREFIPHVHSAVQKTGEHGVTFMVDTGHDAHFKSTPKHPEGKAGAYVSRDDTDTVRVSPHYAQRHTAEAMTNLLRNNPFSQGHFSPAAQHTDFREYSMVHELGHIHDFRGQHVNSLTGSGKPGNVKPSEGSFYTRQPKSDLSRYGSANANEGYAEAFAQHHLSRPEGLPDTDSDRYDRTNKVAGDYAARYGWKNHEES